MERTHKVSLRVELQVALHEGRNLAELALAVERYLDELNFHLARLDDRRQWSTLVDHNGSAVAELGSTKGHLVATEVTIARNGGDPILQYQLEDR